jgi:hypothetical protein
VLGDIARLKNARTLRESSWSRDGRNRDSWTVPPGEKRVLADLPGPGCVTHVWMTQNCRRFFGASKMDSDPDYFRKVLLRIFWDGEKRPSVLAPLGDFFCQGHSIVSNFCSLPFSASTNRHGAFGGTVALNCYLPMPFRKRCRIEVENQNDVPYVQYFYVDYELYDQPLDDDVAYLHAQWRRENPTDGWGHDVQVNTPEANVANLDGKGNYVICDARGRGHYIGCNLSVTNLQGTWWGEGDDMIWVDGYKWPPDLHGTGSEDFLNQAYGMQPNAYLFNGSSLWEHDRPPYQVSYVFYLTNPVHFRKSLLVTMEHGHGNHLANEWSSTAYWYQLEPHKPFGILPVSRRLPIRSDLGVLPVTPKAIPRTKLTAEMKRNKRRAQARAAARKREQQTSAKRTAAAQRAAVRKMKAADERRRRG